MKCYLIAISLAITTQMTAQKGIDKLKGNIPISKLIGSNQRMFGGDSNNAISGEFSNKDGKFKLCNLRAGTANRRFETKGCLELKEYGEYENEYDALYEGNISEYDDYKSVTKKFSVLVRISKTLDRKYAFSFCVYNENGYPDCGMGEYAGVLKIEKKSK